MKINNCPRCNSNKIKTELKIKSDFHYKKIRIYEIICKNCELNLTHCDFLHKLQHNKFHYGLSKNNLKKMTMEKWNIGKYNE